MWCCPGVNSRTTTWQKCDAVPRRARIYGSYDGVSLNSRLQSNKEEEVEEGIAGLEVRPAAVCGEVPSCQAHTLRLRGDSVRVRRQGSFGDMLN